VRPGEILAVLRDAENDLPTTTWSQDPTVHLPVVAAYTGKGSKWSFTVVFWKEGERFAYDGAATSENTITRLTPEVAEKAFKLAEAQCQQQN
jgi:hypothetical protein